MWDTRKIPWVDIKFCNQLQKVPLFLSHSHISNLCPSTSNFLKWISVKVDDNSRPSKWSRIVCYTCICQTSNSWWPEILEAMFQGKSWRWNMSTTMKLWGRGTRLPYINFRLTPHSLSLLNRSDKSLQEGARIPTLFNSLIVSWNPKKKEIFVQPSISPSFKSTQRTNKYPQACLLFWVLTHPIGSSMGGYRSAWGCVLCFFWLLHIYVRPLYGDCHINVAPLTDPPSGMTFLCQV